MGIYPKRVLMTKPIGFEVAYSINPYMSDENGNLKIVDKSLAMKQWTNLRSLFEKLGLEVFVVDGREGLPDMVFCANQTFPYFDREGRTSFVMSHMATEYRQTEVVHYADWARGHGFNVVHLKTESTFEGMGDALWNYESQEIYGGYGFRTSAHIYDELENIVGAPVHRIELIDERFYHLDTCMAIVNKDTAMVVKEAFGRESHQLLRRKFKNLVEIPLNEAVNHFAGNMTAINGTDVVLHPGAHQTVSFLNELGMRVHEVDTSEFMKSGGSVFCMKQLF